MFFKCFLFIYAIGLCSGFRLISREYLSQKRFQTHCNNRDCFIVGGEPIDIEKVPFMVSLKIRSSQGTGLCGGSIISKRHVLTAAHCTEMGKITVFAGSSDVFSGQKFEVKRNFSLPGWVVGSRDIAILELEKDLQFSSKVQPISLPNTIPAADKMVSITGWGVTEAIPMYPFLPPSSKVLITTSVPIYGWDHCNEIYSEYGGIHEDTICAGSKEGGQGCCFGDSGGPMVFNDTVIGTVSGGPSCAQPGQPALFVNVLYHLDWINEIINANSLC